MQWFFRILTSSIGKKVQMALTGLLLCGFLVAHLGGNLFLYKGQDAFNHYAELVEENPLLPAAEIGLLVLFALHILTAMRVWWENRRARPIGYIESASAGAKTLGSSTMIYSGILLLVFLVIHLKSFRFAEDEGNLYGLVITAFQNKLYASFYIISMGALALHLSHGFQSGFQTLGIHHPKYTPLIRRAGWIFAAAISMGFASIALWAGFYLQCSTCWR